ncbi:hypothetical protein CUJ83_09720 [Methanocella sp. CWC-04]|uniref:Uncharacterized protein n=1 Tax=Methanooceanicella nereidis TaxID=2052831 RepID=A0AAP2RCZ5_9EURY|nr:hypothetical protein [Methanocella sp. CWC-04]MCD1295276.1 hypothetical protein [Methanocella sp. CWC-04]
MSTESNNPDILRTFIYTNYTDTIKYAVDLDDNLINNPSQAINEFRKFYKNFIILYLVTNNFLGDKRTKDEELSKLFENIEAWIGKIKMGKYNNPKTYLDPISKDIKLEGNNNMENAIMLMHEGIILFNDYSNQLIKNMIIKID